MYLIYVCVYTRTCAKAVSADSGCQLRHLINIYSLAGKTI